MIPKEPAIRQELEALKHGKDELIIETRAMGEKCGTLSEIVQRDCERILEEFRKLDTYIRNHL